MLQDDRLNLRISPYASLPSAYTRQVISRSKLLAAAVAAVCLGITAMASPAAADFGHKSMFGKLAGLGAIGLADSEFDNPIDMSMGPAASVYVLEGKDCSVRVLSTDGDHVRRWSPGCAAAPNSAIGLYAPTSLAVDMFGNVYIADLFRIRVYSAFGVYLRDIGNSFVQSGTGEYLQQPARIDVDLFSATPNVYVVDTNAHRVAKFASDGTFLMTAGQDVIEGNLESGFEVCTVALDCRNGQSTSGPEGFSSPAGVAVSPDGSQLAVLDNANNRVRFFDPATLQLTSRAETGYWGSYDVAFAGNSTSIYLSRPFQSSVVRAEPDGTTFEVFGGTNSSDDGLFGAPRAAAGTAGGQFWVMDQSNHRVGKFSATGVQTGSVGKNPGSGAGFGSANGSFNRPTDVTVDSAGDIWVADYENHRVQKFNSSFVHQYTIGGTQGSLGGQFYRPMAVAREGNYLWVADAWNNRIQKFNASTGAFVLAIGKDVETGGATSGELCMVAANCKAGVSGSGNSEFAFPTDIAISPTGSTMYVSDQNNARIEFFDLMSHNHAGRITLPAANYPRALAVNADGDIYVVIPGSFGTGTVALMSTAGSTIVSRSITDNPGLYGVAIVGDRVLVTAANANKIFNFDTSLNYATPSRYSTRGSNPGDVASPAGIAASPGTPGDVFVAELDNHRVQKFGDVTRPTPTVQLTAPSADVVQYNDNTIDLDFTSDDGYGNELKCAVRRLQLSNNEIVYTGAGRGEAWVPFSSTGFVFRVLCDTPFDSLPSEFYSNEVVVKAIEDLTGPVITINEPVGGSTTDASSVVLDYDAADAIDPDPPTCDVADGATVPLSYGANTISVSCSDVAGNSTTQSVVVTRPPPPDPPTTPPAAVEPNATIKFAKTVRFRGSMKATITCDRACPLELTITARVGKKRYAAKAVKSLTSAGTTTLTVKWRKNITAKLTKSIKTGAKVNFTYVLKYGAKQGKSGKAAKAK